MIVLTWASNPLGPQKLICMSDGRVSFVASIIASARLLLPLGLKIKDTLVLSASSLIRSGVGNALLGSKQYISCARSKLLALLSFSLASKGVMLINTNYNNSFFIFALIFIHT